MNIFGPINTSYCIYFNILSIFGICVLFGILLSVFIYPKIFKNNTYFIYYVVIYTMIYFQNRLLYNMCISNNKIIENFPIDINNSSITNAIQNLKKAEYYPRDREANRPVNIFDQVKDILDADGKINNGEINQPLVDTMKILVDDVLKRKNTDGVKNNIKNFFQNNGYVYGIVDNYNDSIQAIFKSVGDGGGRNNLSDNTKGYIQEIVNAAAAQANANKASAAAEAERIRKAAEDAATEAEKQRLAAEAAVAAENQLKQLMGIQTKLKPSSNMQVNYHCSTVSKPTNCPVCGEQPFCTSTGWACPTMQTDTRFSNSSSCVTL